MRQGYRLSQIRSQHIKHRLTPLNKIHQLNRTWLNYAWNENKVFSPSVPHLTHEAVARY